MNENGFWSLLDNNLLGKGTFGKGIGGKGLMRRSSDNLRYPLPYTVDFSTLADGALPVQFTGTTWAVASGKAVNTPPTTGAEMLTNGAVETTDGWTASSSVISAVADPRTGSNGANSLNVARNGANFPAALQNLVATQGSFYQLTGWLRNVDQVNAQAALRINSGTTVILGSIASTAVTDWAQFVVTGQTTDATLRVFLNGNATGKADGTSTRFDDLSLLQIANGAVFALMPTTQANVICKAGTRIVDGTQAGVIINANSLTVPTSYVLASYSRGSNKALLEKVVNGVKTTLVTVTAGYVEDGVIEVRKSGTTYQLFYNNAQIGTDQTISDAEIINNTIHGLFSTYGGNSLNPFFCWRTDAEQYSLTTIGDSITAAVNSWADRVSWYYPQGVVTLHNHAEGGASVITDGDADADMAAQVAASAGDAPNTIIVALGTNDTETGAPFQTEYSARLAALKAAHASAEIYCMGILNRVEEAGRVEKNTMIEAACTANGVTFWNTDGWIDPETDLVDLVHPNAAGHQKITVQILARLP